MDRQCSSCGGFCKKSGCERENVKPEPEPVAWRFHDRNMWWYVDHLTDLPQDKFKPLYTAPPQREWVGLTDEERLKTYLEAGSSHTKYGKAIEAKLKDKNT